MVQVVFKKAQKWKDIDLSHKQKRKFIFNDSTASQKCI